MRAVFEIVVTPVARVVAGQQRGPPVIDHGWCAVVFEAVASLDDRGIA